MHIKNGSKKLSYENLKLHSGFGKEAGSSHSHTDSKITRIMKESSDELHPVSVLCHDMRMLLYFSCFVVGCLCVCFESYNFEMQLNYWCFLMYRLVLKNWSDHQNLKICLLQPKIIDGIRIKQFDQSYILHFAKCSQPASLRCAILGKSRLPFVCCEQMIIFIEPVAPQNQSWWCFLGDMPY